MWIQVQSSLHAAHIHILDESKKFSSVLMAAAMPTFYGLYLYRFEAMRNCTAVATEYTCAVPFELMQHISSVNLHKHAHLLTPWGRVLLQKLTGSQLLKIFPAFYGTRRFITGFTRARHLSLS